MTSSRHDEVERKYVVDQVTILPSLADLDGVSSMSQAVEQELEAVYYDTAELDLARHGTTLRRRTGGDDAGWHLKLPRTGDTRIELHRPLGLARRVPEQLLLPVRPLVRDRQLVPVAGVHTRRREHTLLGAEGIALARVCDDQVHAERLRGPSQIRDWREWEGELGDGDPALLDVVEQRLLAADAKPASAASKLIRTLGDAAPAGANDPAPKRLSATKLSRGSAAQLVRAHLAAQVAELHTQDTRLRVDEPGSVHKLRIASRRLRSTLKTYRPLLEPGAADTLGEELRWLGQSLAQARDAQVLRERLDRLLDSEPIELVLGPV